MSQINVMIIEDDFRIARIHQEMVEQHPAFTVVNSSLNARKHFIFYGSVRNFQASFCWISIYQIRKNFTYWKR